MENSKIPTLPVPRTSPPKTRLGRWLCAGERPDEHQSHAATHPWYSVLWLTGVDYFSTLGYQPGIALLAAGILSPLATAILIAVTLLGALPIYAQVAKRSYVGQGSIAMLEELFTGWQSKLFVLVMLGFASTDFVITMTLSAADAAQHVVENPVLRPLLGEHRYLLTLGFLAVLAMVFLRGFVEAIGLAMIAAIPYLVLTFVVICRATIEILRRPELITQWQDSLTLHGDWTGLLLASALIFPKLALGMSGFETGVSVMPLIRSDTQEGTIPTGRIAATRKLLWTAALIMSFFLVGSSFITTLLIPASAYQEGGPASGRAISFLAHQLLGSGFGTLYDLTTIVILWFAGASAMAAMLYLIPRYLPRFGMAPKWAAYHRPLVFCLFAINTIVTIAFSADVEAQAGAYATGVLALMLSAAIAVAIALWKEFKQNGDLRPALVSLYFWGVTSVFAFTFLDNIVERPGGIIISGIFIGLVLTLGSIGRCLRATELRVAELSFADETSAALWPLIKGKKVHLVPLRTAQASYRRKKVLELKKYYQVNGSIAFVHVNLLDNRSEFLSRLEIRITQEEEGFVITISKAIALANTIAYVSEIIDPISIFLGLTRENLMLQSFRYLLWGEGETGLMIYKILLRYWEWTAEDDVRPLIFMMSE